MTTASPVRAPVRVIDTHYLGQPQVAAAYLLADSGRAAFVDNNTARALPHLAGALRDAGLVTSQVEYVIVTHVHLDHAGGTSALARLCPDAIILCHPRAEKHLLDPAKLERSARRVYGDEAFDRLYGAIEPIDPARVVTLDDDATVQLGRRTLRVLHTRGHANHHFCVLDETLGEVFTGDAFGIAYPRLQRAGLFAFPSTSPTDFDADLARAAVRRIVETGATKVYLAHFGAVTAVAEAAAQLDHLLAVAGETLEAAMASDLPDSELAAFCRPRLDAAFEAAAARAGLTLDADDRAFLELDLDLNAQGVAFQAAKRRADA